mmetsp:Transcript_2767/g.9288  ORF Transcript_2767/g.9288 Transcript_2767/m.9288 type:complete len:162 (-) Transcript_2767:1452-1937(-)
MFMQYEGDIPVVKPVQELRTRTRRYVPPGVRTTATAKSETEILQERFRELSKEVDENQKFLQEMSSTGKVAPPPCPPSSSPLRLSSPGLFLPFLSPSLNPRFLFRASHRPLSPLLPPLSPSCSGSAELLQAGDYTAIVNGAISEKMREMQAIDKKLEKLGV